MQDGFFYISNGLSGKVMEFNSYGDILNLYYNEEYHTSLNRRSLSFGLIRNGLCSVIVNHP